MEFHHHENIHETFITHMKCLTEGVQRILLFYVIGTGERMCKYVHVGDSLRYFMSWTD